jgi:hypothetical protein
VRGVRVNGALLGVGRYTQRLGVPSLFVLLARERAHRTRASEALGGDARGSLLRGVGVAVRSRGVRAHGAEQKHAGRDHAQRHGADFPAEPHERRDAVNGHRAALYPSRQRARDDVRDPRGFAAKPLAALARRAPLQRGHVLREERREQTPPKRRLHLTSRGAADAHQSVLRRRLGGAERGELE